MQLVETPTGGAIIDVLDDLSRVKEHLEAATKTMPHDEAHELERKTKDLVKKVRRYTGENRGESVIKEYLAQHTQPTLFISEDVKARKQVMRLNREASQAPVYVCNSAGLFEVLKNAGIFKQCGISDWVSSEHLIIEIQSKIYGEKPSKALLTPHAAVVGESRTKPENKLIDHWFSR